MGARGHRAHGPEVSYQAWEVGSIPFSGAKARGNLDTTEREKLAFFSRKRRQGKSLGFGLSDAASGSKIGTTRPHRPSRIRGIPLVRTLCLPCHPDRWDAALRDFQKISASGLSLSWSSHQIVRITLDRRISRSAVTRGSPSTNAVAPIMRSAGSFG